MTKNYKKPAVKTETKAVQNGNEAKPKKEIKSPQEKLGERKNRKVARKQKGQYKVSNVTLSAKALQNKIKEIEAKGTPTKTARRRLAVYRKKLAIETGVDIATLKSAAANKKQLAQAKQGNAGPGSILRVQKGQPAKRTKKDEDVEKKIKQIKVEPQDDDDDDDEDDDIDLEGEVDEDSEDDEEEDDDDSEPDDDAAEKNAANKNQQAQKNQQDGKKKRYVLFVGNIPFDITTDELKTHFLTKVSAVTSVRIPPKQGNKPRGIAYVELTNEIDFEKALSLHHSFLKGRRINVQYTAGGSNPAGHKAEIVAKNKKLHALRQQGKLAGGQQKSGPKFGGMKGRPFQKRTNT